MNVDYTTMTDDELTDIRHALAAEYKRREAEPKKPIFIVDGIAYKDLDIALDKLVHQIDYCRNFEGGAIKYLADSIENERLVFGLTFEHWSETEYSARPDKVYGY